MLATGLRDARQVEDMAGRDAVARARLACVGSVVIDRRIIVMITCSRRRLYAIE